jgi:hypothetical protein
MVQRKAIMKVAAITMAYNEVSFLPIWARHYSAQVGASHCYVVDHGSDDGSTDNLGPINRIKIPRSPQDDGKRAKFVSEFCESLLNWYDWVLYTDTDEIVIADPARSKNLIEYCKTCSLDTVTAYGFNVLQVLGEHPFSEDLPVLTQRSWMQFSSPMSKPTLTRTPIKWTAGFHVADADIQHDDLYLFHLRWFDLDISARRLARTRSQAWQYEDAGWWQRVDDDTHAQMFLSKSQIPQFASIEIGRGSPELRAAVETNLGPSETGTWPFVTPAHFHEPNEAWPIPERFKSII